MNEHEIDMMTQAATRLAAERWHNTAFVLRMQAQAAASDYDRHWLGMDAKQAERYAQHLDRQAREMASVNDPLDNLDVEQRVAEARWIATHDTIPDLNSTWEQALPPPGPWRTGPESVWKQPTAMTAQQYAAITTEAEQAADDARQGGEADEAELRAGAAFKEVVDRRTAELGFTPFDYAEAYWRERDTAASVTDGTAAEGTSPEIQRRFGPVDLVELPENADDADDVEDAVERSGQAVREASDAVRELVAAGADTDLDGIALTEPEQLVFWHAHGDQPERAACVDAEVGYLDDLDTGLDNDLGDDLGDGFDDGGREL